MIPIIHVLTFWSLFISFLVLKVNKRGGFAHHAQFTWQKTQTPKCSKFRLFSLLSVQWQTRMSNQPPFSDEKRIREVKGEDLPSQHDPITAIVAKQGTQRGASMRWSCKSANATRKRTFTKLSRVTVIAYSSVLWKGANWVSKTMNSVNWVLIL